jgi:hypothetical protein
MVSYSKYSFTHYNTKDEFYQCLMLRMLRVNAEGISEEWFFSILSNDDLWKELASLQKSL